MKRVRNLDFAKSATIGELVAQTGDAFGNKTAFRMADGRKRSFRDVAVRSRQLGAALRSRGLSAGDRIAILSKNCIECLEVLFASSTGLIPVPLNWRLSARELATVLVDCSPRAIIVDGTHRATVELIRSFLPPQALLIHLDGPEVGWLGYDDVISDGDPGLDDLRPRPSDTACIIYTSGTTGQPKGVELSHRGLLLNCQVAIDDVLCLNSQDEGLTCMPLFHVGGMWYHAFPTFAAGSTMTLVPEFNAQTMLQLMEVGRTSHVHLVPTMLHALLAQPHMAERDLGSLRLIYYAASSIPVDLLDRATRAFSRCDFVQGYGSSEAGMVAQLTAEDHRTAKKLTILRSCGRPFDGISVRLEPIAGEAAGIAGELLIQSPMCMRGYWNNAQATAKVFDDGWLRTGDVASIDEGGYLTILDRKDDMIVTGGENVFPREVEEILIADPDVAEAAVFGLPDQRWVQKVVAAVVLHKGRAAGEVALLCRLKSQLAAYKCPKEIFFTDRLPRNGAGKLLRTALRSKYGTSTKGP
jgi:acyl-CoA synthetase (AMP-forming)/AMP-acid ligase II